MSEVKNVALLRTDTTYVEASQDEGSYGRREMYVQLGGLRDTPKAIALGERILATHLTPHTTYAIEGLVLDGSQLPGADYHLGDKLAGQTVVGMSITTDDNGVTSVTPELVDPLLIERERIDRTLARMASGGGSASAHPSTADNPSSSGGQETPPPYSLDGHPVVGPESPSWTCPRPYMLSWIEVTSNAPPLTASKIEGILSAPPYFLGPYDIGLNQSDFVIPVGVQIRTGTKLHFRVTQSGDQWSGVTITPRGAVI